MWRETLSRLIHSLCGGLTENMHKAKREKRITGRGGIDKAIVQGVLERGGLVSTHVVPNTLGSTLRTNVANQVEFGATVYTDAHGGYTGLWKRYTHSTIDHAKEYVRGMAHTNGIENFWSLFKRCIKGTWIHLSEFHLERYSEEEAFRYNHRKMNDGERFWAVLRGVVGRRITYRQLCMIDDCGFMGIE